jgi:hypothetical protein
VTRSARPFQVIYALWWYAILNGGDAIDFMGAGGPGPALIAALAMAFVLSTLAWHELRHAHRR